MKVQVLKIHDEYNGHTLYRLDDKKSAIHFFDDMLNNAEIGEMQKISIEELTPEEWAEAEKSGNEMA